MDDKPQKTLGQAIDEIITALEALEESARVTAVRAACDALKVPILEPSSQSGLEAEAGMMQGRTSGAGSSPSTGGAAPADIRTFKEQKSPANALEMAAVVAYYLKMLAPTEARKTEITAKDLEEYFVQGDFKIPKYIAQVLVDAKDAGYFQSVGRGLYKLNPVGHNLVAHSLPRISKGKG